MEDAQIVVTFRFEWCWCLFHNTYTGRYLPGKLSALYILYIWPRNSYL